MTKSVLGLLLCAGIFCGSAHAQTDAHLKLAEKLLTVMELQKTLEQSFGAITKMIPGQGQSEAGQKVLAMILQELSWENIKGDYIHLYAEVFTEAEIKDLIAFYESPGGRAYVKKQPELTQKSMVLSQQMMMKIMPKLPGMGY
jgi:uncharacterized protein